MGETECRKCSLSLRPSNFTRICLSMDHSIPVFSAIWSFFQYIDLNALLFCNISLNCIFKYLFCCLCTTMFSLLETPVMTMQISFACLWYLLFSLQSFFPFYLFAFYFTVFYNLSSLTLTIFSTMSVLSSLVYFQISPYFCNSINFPLLS